ncbi:MAG: alanyl-tRNA editing protein [Candidatus Parvarchaeota archaeon]|nr:alanyl-tRNA editing protein [Candidatus Parvarchaeota archaeon]MCW1295343.1 alanyl-tRNA editing protein [Candidatus Parvarchaeum tengchongense]MCW1299056.1 alanyl-tRNA editing protein [Candidatus Parvarchaeum tengchongense]MCW1311993.1 alanyl-tRNA editing protein [Candidatus Parvarchaeum tengchongense]
MTEKLYLKDSYLRETNAKITNINGSEITVDTDIFYPSGGGQPADSGKVLHKENEYTVNEIKKDGEDIVLLLDKAIDANKGDEIKEIIDWSKRYAHMKLHTAIHIIDGVLERDYNSSLITGNQIYDDRARIDISMDGLTKELASGIIEKANSVISEGHEVNVKFLTKEEAANKNLVRTQPGRELMSKLDIIRVIEIAGLDEQMDGGTHVKNTKEVGHITLESFENKGKQNKRLYIKLNG